MKEFFKHIWGGKGSDTPKVETPKKLSDFPSHVVFDEDFKVKFEQFRGKWLCDEKGIVYVLNFYHQKDGIVHSLDFNVGDLESRKPVTVTIAGEALNIMLRNEWNMIQEWYQRQDNVKRSLRKFSYVINKANGFKTKSEKRASNV